MLNVRTVSWVVVEESSLLCRDEPLATRAKCLAAYCVEALNKSAVIGVGGTQTLVLEATNHTGRESGVKPIPRIPSRIEQTIKHWSRRCERQAA